MPKYAFIDFNFVYEDLIDKYCLDNGRNAIDPIRMFKYFLLKSIYDLSDVDIVERSKYDMSFKYFLDMAPEEDVINSNSLTFSAENVPWHILCSLDSTPKF